MKSKIKEVLYTFIIIFMGAIILTPILIKACDAEYEYQQAKSEQWQQDIKDGKPFTDFNN